MPLKKLCQICRCSGFVPVIFYIHFIKCIYYTERIVYICLKIITEMISVVLFFQHFFHFICGVFHPVRHFTYRFCKIWVQFIFCYSAYRVISSVHTYVFRLIKSWKHRHLTEFGYTCQKYKTKIFICSLKRSIKSFKSFPVFLFLFCAKYIQYRFIVLIYEYYRFMSGFLMCCSK